MWYGFSMVLGGIPKNYDNRVFTVKKTTTDLTEPNIIILSVLLLISFLGMFVGGISGVNYRLVEI